MKAAGRQARLRARDRRARLRDHRSHERPPRASGFGPHVPRPQQSAQGRRQGRRHRRAADPARRRRRRHRAQAPAPSTTSRPSRWSPITAQWAATGDAGRRAAARSAAPAASTRSPRARWRRSREGEAWKSRARYSSSPARRRASAKARRACWWPTAPRSCWPTCRKSAAQAIAAELGQTFVRCDVTQEADGRRVVEAAIGAGQADGPGQLRRHRAGGAHRRQDRRRTRSTCSPRSSRST